MYKRQRYHISACTARLTLDPAGPPMSDTSLSSNTDSMLAAADAQRNNSKVAFRSRVTVKGKPTNIACRIPQQSYIIVSSCSPKALTTRLSWKFVHFPTADNDVWNTKIQTRHLECDIGDLTETKTMNRRLLSYPFLAGAEGWRNEGQQVRLS